MTDHPAKAPPVVQFLSMPGLASIDLGNPQPKPTSISGEQLEASKQLWCSSDGAMRIGIWECTPGRFSAIRDTSSETCYILAGRVSLHGPDGVSQELATGDMLVLPQGWRGEWTIHEHTRKLYILHSDAG
jgi:uncharacterized cupin superfamily protein